MSEEAMTDRVEALYYPFLQFRSRRWLRMMALYYDSLARIVPEGVDPDAVDLYHFLPETRATALLSDIRELKSIGFLTEVRPEPYTAKVADKFLDFAIANLVDSERRQDLIVKLLLRLRLYRIHPKKIDPGLVDVLRELQLVHEKKGDPFSDIAIEAVTGAFYMLALATTMAGNAQLVSDSSLYQALLYKPLPAESVRPASRRTSEFRLASAVFDLAFPDSIEDVPLDKVLRLREDLQEQRTRFRDKVSTLAESLEGKDGGAADSAQIERQVRSVMDEYHKGADRIRSLNLSLGSAVFSVSVPSYITADWGLHLTSGASLVAAAAVALSIGVIKHVLDRRMTEFENPYTYVLNASRRLDVKKAADDMVGLHLTDVIEDDEESRHGGIGARVFR